MRNIKKPSYIESVSIGRLYLKILLVVCVIFGLRLAQLMLFKTSNGQDLTKLVTQLYNREDVITARRGNIYDVSGDIVATDVKTYSLYAVLTDEYKGVAKVEDKVTTAKKLAKHLKLSESDVLGFLNKSNVNQVSFGNAGTNLSFDTKEAIVAEQLPGIYFNEKISRHYPKGYFSNNIIGLAQDVREDTSVEIDTNPLRGVTGLELVYNAQLTGIDGIVQYEKDVHGLPIAGSQNVIEQVQHGHNIYTTIDSRLNDYLETIVQDAFETYKPKALNVMVVRPKTGDVVAVTQRPTFNVSAQLYPENGWVNQLVENAFEPGSTMKALLLAAVVNEGIYSPMDLYRSGSVEVGNITIHDWNVSGWGTITYLDGLAQSSNVAFVNLVSQLGYDKWKNYLDAFGFGKSTQSGFANESAGVNNYSTEEVKASTAFGQGISVTNLQMVQAFTAIANEGKMQKLRFVDRIENATTGNVTYQPVESINTPLTPAAAKQTLDYLKQAVYRDSSTAVSYRLDNTEIALKTGTAQIYDEARKKYLLDEGNYIYSMVGYLPAQDPEYLVYITMEHSSAAALPVIFKQFANFALTYINKNKTASDEVSTQTKPVEQVTVPDAVNASVKVTKDAFEKLGFKDLYFFGTQDTVIKQMPVDNTVYRTDEKMMFYTGGAIVMPNMVGWTYQDVQRFGQLTGLTIKLNGQGYVTQQSIPTGQVIDNPSNQIELTITLQAKQTETVTKKETTTTTSEQSSSTTSTTR
ncbi:transpeptidase family protein [Carnobacteriaceae bacterium zg-ZUI252]|nr:transpeptidase family protein [Carnobacteriaceae bacterium zg-ZUI252]QTU82699.1 transpeptidase family protein [Carnobacteriaceae bacterium zg-C25]